MRTVAHRVRIPILATGIDNPKSALLDQRTRFTDGDGR